MPIVLPPFWAFSSFCHISKSQKVPCERSEADIRKINTIKVTLYALKHSERPPNDLRNRCKPLVSPRNAHFAPSQLHRHFTATSQTPPALQTSIQNSSMTSSKTPLYRPEMLVFGDILRIWHYTALPKDLSNTRLMGACGA